MVTSRSGVRIFEDETPAELFIRRLFSIDIRSCDEVYSRTNQGKGQKRPANFHALIRAGYGKSRRHRLCCCRSRIFADYWW